MQDWGTFDGKGRDDNETTQEEYNDTWEHPISITLQSKGTLLISDMVSGSDNDFIIPIIYELLLILNQFAYINGDMNYIVSVRCRMMAINIFFNSVIYNKQIVIKIKNIFNLFTTHNISNSAYFHKHIEQRGFFLNKIQVCVKIIHLNKIPS